MKILLNVRMVLLLVAMGLLTVFTSCGNLDKKGMEEIADLQESFPTATSRAENVTITGTLTTQERKEPLEGATVQVGTQSTLTKADGTFQLVLEETNGNTLASIKLRGCTDLFFTVDFGRYEDGDMVDWSAQLSRLQRAIQYTPGQESSRTFNSLGVLYAVTIPEDAAPQPFAVHVGPSGTIVGKGIPGSFALVNLSIQTADETGFHSGVIAGPRNFRFAEAIEVRFDILLAATTGGIGSLNPAALLPGANVEAVEAAENYIDAINDAQTILFNGGNEEDALKVLVIGLYGDEDADEEDDVDSVLFDEDGNLILSSDFSGIVLPGIGLVTRDGNLILLTNEGELVEEIDLTDPDEGGSIPHQATADGDG